jgi:hypothetical protein
MEVFEKVAIGPGLLVALRQKLKQIAKLGLE